MTLCWWLLIRGQFSTKREMWSCAEVTAGTFVGQLQHSTSVVMGYVSRKRRDKALGSRGCFSSSSHPQYFFYLSNCHSDGDILRVGVPCPYVRNQINFYFIFITGKSWRVVEALMYPCLICLTQGQKTEAERYFLKAIQLDPGKGNCYMHYGEHRHISASLNFYSVFCQFN